MLSTFALERTSPSHARSPAAATTMPSQQADIAETIAALRRALNREKDGKQTLAILRSDCGSSWLTFSPYPAPSAEPILAASNRGNKLQQGAKYVHEGTLAFMRGPDAYKHVRQTFHFHRKGNQLALMDCVRKSSMLVMLDIYSSATLADITSTEMSLTIVKVI